MKRPTRPLTKSETRTWHEHLSAITGKPLHHTAPELVAKRERVKSAIPTESQEQRAFIKWWRMQYPSIRIFAIPNGGMRDAITGAILRAEGALPGVPDMFVPALSLWLEMKRIKGSIIGESQQDWHEYLVAECGHTVLVTHGCDDAIAQVRLFMKYHQSKETA